MGVGASLSSFQQPLEEMMLTQRAVRRVLPDPVDTVDGAERDVTDPTRGGQCRLVRHAGPDPASIFFLAEGRPEEGGSRVEPGMTAFCSSLARRY